MTQDLSFGAPNSESNSGAESLTVLSVSIADPYVLLRMSDGSIRLLTGGIPFHYYLASLSKFECIPGLLSMYLSC